MKTLKGNTMRKFIISLLLLSAPSLLAAPEGGQVAAGQAAISQAGLTTSINQLSDQAIINWQGFDIGVNELVKFLQPGANSVALNRIVGGDARQILGQLNADGRIFIVNPAGVVFGSTAQVDVGSLLATTLDITDENFLNGDFQFEKVDGAEASFILNAGSIKVGDNGFAFLVAPSVDNQGLIVAKLGSVGLASGDTLTLDFRGDGLVTYAVSSEVAGQVSNSGSISGNQVVLGADVGADVLSGVVNNTGIIEATSLVERDGKVVLSGELVRHAGSIAAQGGSVSIESTRQSLVTSDATIDVSGGDSGDAGTVAILSDNRSTFNGSIDARGGTNGGDGGFVDVSSAGQVELNGIVDASAASGSTGTLLIDPKNIDVNDTGGVAFTDTVNNEFNNDFAADTIISAVSINAQVTDVVLQANTDITVTDAIDLSATPNVGITLQAGRSVLVNADITTDGGSVAVIANDVNAVELQREAGVATIALDPGATIDAGAGDISLTIDATGHGDVGDLNISNLDSSGPLPSTPLEASASAQAFWAAATFR
jgi:trimeric autotransporter adhesin